MLKQVSGLPTICPSGMYVFMGIRLGHIFFREALLETTTYFLLSNSVSNGGTLLVGFPLCEHLLQDKSGIKFPPLPKSQTTTVCRVFDNLEIKTKSGRTIKNTIVLSFHVELYLRYIKILIKILDCVTDETDRSICECKFKIDSVEE